MKIIDLREYKILEGKTNEWLHWMKEEVLPYQRSKGMKILQTYIHTNEFGDDYFFWLREFESEQDKQRIYENTYNEKWISEFRPRIFTLIDEASISVKELQSVSL